MTDATGPDFQALFEAAPGLYLVLNPDFVIVAASDAYLSAIKKARADVVGRGIFDLYPNYPDDPATGHVNDLEASLTRVLQLRQGDTMTMHSVLHPEA